MTASAEQDGSYQEVFQCSIAKISSPYYHFAGIIEEITPTEGDKDGEAIATGTGGRVWKRTPETEFEVTMKIYPLDLDVHQQKDMAQYFLGGSYGSSNPISQRNTRGRDLFRIVILWNDFDNPGGATVAIGTTGVGNAARRMIFDQARVTGYKESFDDKVLSAEVTFKGPAFNRAGTGNILRESSGSTAGTELPQVSAYT